MQEWIRGYIERIIIDVISEDAYQALGPAELSEISLQVTLFVSNILLSVAGTAFLGLLAYLVVNRHQTKAARVTLEIERQRLLHDLEETHGRLSSTPCVRFPASSRFRADVVYAFVVALTREVQWAPPGRIRYEWSTGDRYLVFSHDGALLSSTELHNFLFWFRRVHRARVAGLLHPSDLYDLWRQVLPFVTDARYTFLVEYFGGKVRLGEEDVEALRGVVVEILRFCQRNGKKVPLNYLSGRMDPLLHVSLPAELTAGIETGQVTLAEEGPAPAA